MKRNFVYFVLTICILTTHNVEGQFLDRVAPVTLTKNNLTISENTSFVLSAVDYNFYVGKGTPYSNTIQVLDAAKPWPPVWFTCTPFSSTEYTLEGESNALLDASVQNGKLTFFSLIDTKEKEGALGRKQSYLSLDK